MKTQISKKCPVCNSTRFKNVIREMLSNANLSHKTCLRCGYTHKITKEEFK